MPLSLTILTGAFPVERRGTTGGIYGGRHAPIALLGALAAPALDRRTRARLEPATVDLA